MNIESIVLRQIQVKLKAPFETSFGKTWERRVVLVEVICDGLSGWGEVTAGEGPFYNSETTDTSWLILEKIYRAVGIGGQNQRSRGHSGCFAG